MGSKLSKVTQALGVLVLGTLVSVTGTPQSVTPVGVTHNGCVLKHVVYDARPTDVWLGYATRDGVEVKLLSDEPGEKGLRRAEKECNKWVRQESPRRKSNVKGVK